MLIYIYIYSWQIVIDNWCKLASTYYIYVYVFTVELLSREVDLVSRKRSGDSRWKVVGRDQSDLVIAIYHIPRFGVSFHCLMKFLNNIAVFISPFLWLVLCIDRKLLFGRERGLQQNQNQNQWPGNQDANQDANQSGTFVGKSLHQFINSFGMVNPV